MKVLAIADRPPRTPLPETIERERPDLIVTLGDLDMYALRGLDTVTDVPKLGVYGNHCSGNYFPEFGIGNMHHATKEVQGVVFGGFEGSIRYKAGDSPMYTEEEATALLADFPYVDVLLTHSPPRGVHDESDPAHQGFEALRDYVLRVQPTYLLHGHTYTSLGTQESLLGRTKIVHVYADQILELDV